MLHRSHLRCNSSIFWHSSFLVGTSPAAIFVVLSHTFVFELNSSISFFCFLQATCVGRRPRSACSASSNTSSVSDSVSTRLQPSDVAFGIASSLSHSASIPAPFAYSLAAAKSLSHPTIAWLQVSSICGPRRTRTAALASTAGTGEQAEPLTLPALLAVLVIECQIAESDLSCNL